MQTIGYFCDSCRVKYVRYMCKDGLPCGHPIEEAVFVYAQNFARSGQSVTLKWDRDGDRYKHAVRLWIWQERHEWNYEFWANSVDIDAGDGAGRERLILGVWLREQEPRIVRAYMNRWESWKNPPEWQRLLQIPADADIFEHLKSDEEKLGILAGPYVMDAVESESQSEIDQLIRIADG